MSFFRKSKRRAPAPAPGPSLGGPCPACGEASFTPVTSAFAATGEPGVFEPMGELVDERTGHCECGLVAWGKVYAPSADAATRQRLALINNTLLLNWVRECKARHREGEATNSAHEQAFYAEARRRLGPDFARLNHAKFVGICLRSAEQQLRSGR
jgi:hypothetical protein